MGRRLGLIPIRIYNRIMAAEDRIETLARKAETFSITPTRENRGKLLRQIGVNLEDATTLGGLHRRTRLPLDRLASVLGFPLKADPEIWSRAGEEILYAPYRERQMEEVKHLSALGQTRIPDSFPFHEIPGLSREIEEKLAAARPHTLGEARILPGMTPAALTALYVAVTLRASGH